MTPAEELVARISRLDRKDGYPYVSRGSSTRVRILEVVGPAGPVKALRYDPNKGQNWRAPRKLSRKRGGPKTRNPKAGSTCSFSTAMIERVAEALQPNVPVSMERLFAAGGNCRSAFEAVLAAMPDVFAIWLSPAGSPGAAPIKHIVRLPGMSHPAGEVAVADPARCDIRIPEGSAAVPVRRPPAAALPRVHPQRQGDLVEIGQALGMRVGIPTNDSGLYDGRGALGDREGLVPHGEVNALRVSSAAPGIAGRIDCMWYTPCLKGIVAGFEVENSTGFKSGLERMRDLSASLTPTHGSPPDACWVVVGREADRERAARIARAGEFASLDPLFLSYEHLDTMLSFVRTAPKHVGPRFFENWATPLIEG